MGLCSPLLEWLFDVATVEKVNAILMNVHPS